MQAAMSRVQADNYARLDPQNVSPELVAIHKQRSSRQQQFDAKFKDLLQRKQAKQHKDFLQVGTQQQQQSCELCACACAIDLMRGLLCPWVHHLWLAVQQPAVWFPNTGKSCLPLAFPEVTPALLQNLPKQCYLESSCENLIWTLGIASIASQLGNLYCTLSLVLRMPLKRE